MRQTVGNACGTVGLLHAAANNAHEIPPGALLRALPSLGCGRRGCLGHPRTRTRRRQLPLPACAFDLRRARGAAADSPLSRFLARTASLDASGRAAVLEEDDSLDAAHAAAAVQGQTAAPSSDDEVNLHFVAFVHVDGGLYELDGRKPWPVRHGGTSADSLLSDAVAVVQRDFLPHAGGDVHFNVVALAPAGGND